MTLPTPAETTVPAVNVQLLLALHRFLDDFETLVAQLQAAAKEARDVHD
jgi:hypothetical protein